MSAKEKHEKFILIIIDQNYLKPLSPSSSHFPNLNHFLWKKKKKKKLGKVCVL